ncbi:MAG: right-handed parallel beta-helix repeat-containing protein [Candidatus Electrothrix sp. ATG2]|nr:right-handed parallel beta-helix repeat-containing protein [Candidatus Electrothrix sp. ATG2]
MKAGVHEINSGIHINRSNVSLRGEQGSVVKLKSGVNQPVFLIGTDVATPTLSDLISNISVVNLEIDGNQLGQTSETDPTRPHIRNNGIDIRTVSDLWINTVDVHDARSGGIVASWKSSNIFISKINAYDNYYDGIALYDSTNIVITDFICNNNDHGAGLSLDNDLKQVIFSNGFIQGNSDVGIFARDSENMLFSSVIVSTNGNHGAFLSHDGASPATTGIKNILFTGCSFQNNSGYGIQFASPSTYSDKNAVTATLFNGNSTGCLAYESGSVTEGGNVCL